MKLFIFGLFYLIILHICICKKQDEKLALTLLRYFEKKHPSKNIIFSPYSLEYAFQMVFEGSNGATYSSIQKTFGFETDTKKRVQLTFEHMKTLLKPNKDYNITMANSIWPDKSLKLQQDYQNILRKYYLAPIEQVDYQTKPKHAQKLINSWVEERTHKKIKNLLHRNVIKKDTRLILVNALYFQANWLHEFHSYNTEKSNFIVSLDNIVQVDMMHQKNNFKYVKAQNHQLLELPYKAKDISMLIVLPTEIDIQPIQDFFTYKIFELEKEMEYTDIDLFLPKFKIHWDTSLVKALKSAKLKYCFSQSADFSQISENIGLHISDVVQKAFIEVNEFGTEAAAATAIIMNRGGVLKQPTYELFNANHPFMYFIIHKKLKKILFEGKVQNPVQ